MLQKDVISPEGGKKLELNPADVTAVNSKGAGDKAFNYVDKSVYFRIHVNANGLINATKDITTVDQKTLGDLLVTDTLPKGWAFQKIGEKDGKYFLLFAGTKSGEAGLVNATQVVDESKYASIFTGGVPRQPTEAEGGKIEFTFTSLKNPYVIVVKAGPTEKTAADYFSTNKTNKGIRNNASIQIQADKTGLANDYEDFSITSSLVTKELNPTNANSDGSLIWNVEYKPYDLEHKNAYLEDTLPVGIDLRTNSKGELLIENNITATMLELKPDGSYTDGAALDIAELKAAISYNPQTRGIHFRIPDTSKAYRLTYITEITGSMGTVHNEVSLLGGGISPTGAEDHKNYNITDANSGASFLRSGWLLVIKQKADGKALAGAEFTLFADDKKAIIRQGTSASDGKIYLKVLPEGDYFLKETAVPSGYVLDGQRHIVTITKDLNGNFVTSIDGKTGDSSNEITVKNHMAGTVGALTIEKTVSGNAGDTTKPFAFTLTLSDTASYPYIGNGVPDGTVKSGDVVSLAHNQSITVTGLPKGTTYTVTERDYSADGYTVSKIGDNGIIVADDTQTAVFTNTKNSKPGGGDNSYIIPQEPLESPELPPALPAAYPSYSMGKLPNPNSPDSPDKITVIDENNAVIGIYTKTAMPDGTFVYISDQGIPLGGRGNPQTGNAIPVGLLNILFIVSLCGAGALILYQKKHRAK